MQRYEFLNEKQIEQIHEATLKILEDIGMEFRYQPALDVFKKAGAKIEGEKVFLTREMVEENVKKAPSQFTLHARNPENNVVIGGDNIAFSPCYGAPFVMDLDKGRRKASMEDFNNFTKMSGNSAYQDFTGGVLVEPCDVDPKVRHMEMLYSCIKNSDKCFMGSATGSENAKDTIDMASILLGVDDLSKKPALITLINTITPLILDARMLGALMEYAKSGQAAIVTSLAMAGSTAPTTLAGTLALQNAEVLSGIVLAQLIREGTPVVYGSASTMTEMKYAALSIGAPEMAVLCNASAQLARYYDVPCRGGGSISDSKTVDAQAGYESMMNLLMAHTSGINFVLHSAGILESYNTACYEKFIVDDEICGMVKRIKKGLEVNEETLAHDVIKEVGPGGHYLAQMHTFNHYKTEFYYANVSDRMSYDPWLNKGSNEAMHVANKRYKDILKEYEAPELPSDIDKDLRNCIEKK